MIKKSLSITSYEYFTNATSLLDRHRSRFHDPLFLVSPQSCNWNTNPTLRPGDIVILDNLSSHKVAGVKDAVAAAGATMLYLPPYSPDLNPIEKLFAKLKA